MSGPYTERIERAVTDGARDAEELRQKAEVVARGGARAAVLGVNDGLVTNICLILGVAAANGPAGAVRVAGFASLVAGAVSMAVGEWVSVRSQVEMYEGVLDELRLLVRRNPKLVLDTLTQRLVDGGFARDTARLVATELPLDERHFQQFTAQTVFGINADELGSPRVAALTSLALFSLGAAVPLAPWLVGSGIAATVTSIVLTAVASMAVGAWVARSSGRPALHGGLRQLLFVVVAAAVTSGVGAAFGTAVA
ncbi:MAG: VIT1/CCC1 transporter family protein [Ilumatobacteraceae bacterium]